SRGEGRNRALCRIQPKLLRDGVDARRVRVVHVARRKVTEKQVGRYETHQAESEPGEIDRSRESKLPEVAQRSDEVMLKHELPSRETAALHARSARRAC